MINYQGGTVYAQYTYDAWGKVLTATGSLASINPLRYRGYYYDTETGWYYLQSRYYDPVVGRFINADGYISTGQGFVGYNMFAYCGNNPIMYIDPSGHLFLELVAVFFIAVSMAVTFTSSSPISTTNIQYSSGNGGGRGSKDYIDPKKPPNPESGYVPPKRNPNPGKVRNPNGAGKGWPAHDGGVWVPDNTQDGGPGWVVQYPGGRHEHRYPDGHVRTHNITNSYSNVTNNLFGGAIIVVSGIGIIIVALDDGTIVGGADNALLPLLIDTFRQGVQMVG